MTDHFESVRKRVRRIIRWRRLKNLGQLVVPLMAHLAGIVTILVAYFVQDGQFDFNPERGSDWLVLLVLGVIAFSGSLVLLKALSPPNRYLVLRSELADLIALARVDAELSVVSLAGDLSWLQEESASLKNLKLENRNVRVSIMYDRARAPGTLQNLIMELESAGVRMIPYPPKVSLPVRCLLVDGESPEAARICVYRRVSVGPVGVPRQKESFEWREIGKEDPATLDFLRSLVSAIGAAGTEVLRIGLSGVNNVGKTGLAKRLSTLLSDRYRVQVCPDVFRTAGPGTTVTQNFVILMSQELIELDGNAEICIYDRTLADNLCFLRLRSADDDAYRELAPKVAVAMSRFDLMFDVRRCDEDYSEGTTLVSGDDRIRVWRYLDEFFDAYGLERTTLYIDSSSIDESLEMAAELAVAEIGARLRARQLSED